MREGEVRFRLGTPRERHAIESPDVQAELRRVAALESEAIAAAGGTGRIIVSVEFDCKDNRTVSFRVTSVREGTRKLLTS